MNRQEILKQNIIDTASFKLPNPFSAWPYFILLVASLLVSTTKLSSQSLEAVNANWENKTRAIAHIEELQSSEDQIATKSTLAKYNRCEMNLSEETGYISPKHLRSDKCSIQNTH